MIETTHTGHGATLISDLAFEYDQEAPAKAYGATLLRTLGARTDPTKRRPDRRNDKRWRQCGFAEMTGYPDAPLLYCPVPIAEYADGVMDAIHAIAPHNTIPHTGADLATIRAKMMGLTRRGDVSAGGSCRFLSCLDGVIALNLARDSDWELLNAWLLTEVEPDWSDVTRHVALQSKSHLLSQGRLLGLAVADAEPDLPSDINWFEISHEGPRRRGERKAPRVINLTSLWAGPLCGQILRWCGAEVTKVESQSRPDGGRIGSPEFFEFLNQGKGQLTLDFTSKRDLDHLKQRILSADIVIEGSRPRALRQLGIVAEDLIDQNPGLTWLSISGYGRQEPQANWIAYGDDAGVAAGLSAEIFRFTRAWMFCGDAIGDPITGLHAALAGLASHSSGGGRLISLSMVNVLQHCLLSAKRMGHA